MKNTINLTKVNGCYSKELREFCPSIKLAVKESSITVSTMKSLVLAIIEPAYINAEAKRRFINNIESCKSKSEIEQLCHDAVIHGMYYRPKQQNKAGGNL